MLPGIPYYGWIINSPIMKIRIVLFLLLATSLAIDGFGQNQNKKPLSPEATVTARIGDASIEIVYCRPSARGRKMLGGNEVYGEIWRTGANAATTFAVDKDVQVEGKLLPAGKYELFTIPREKEWTVIFQKFARQWGAFSYKKENDVLRVNVPASKISPFVETFTIDVEDDRVSLKWENTAVAFKVKG